MNLDIAVGKTLALVGPSGGGKSTATKLLLRFYDPTSGCVKLDGMDIKSLNVAWYRRQVIIMAWLVPTTGNNHGGVGTDGGYNIL